MQSILFQGEPPFVLLVMGNSDLTLPELAILRCEFVIRAEKAVSLPPYLGSTLRGAFGTALKDTVCTVPTRVCAGCRLIETCAYPYIFETPMPPESPTQPIHPQLRGQNEGPHPFIWLAPPLLPPMDNAGWDEFYSRQGWRLCKRRTPVNLNQLSHRLNFPAGAELTFGIWLLGRAIDSLQQIVTAVRLMAATGLGEDRHGEDRIGFKLIEALVRDVAGQRHLIFTRDIRQFSVKPQLLNSWVAARATLLPPAERIRLRFITPTSRVGPKPVHHLKFTDLLSKITQRLEHLASLHGTPPGFTDYRELRDLAGAVNSRSMQLLPFVWEQWSERQQHYIERHSVIGEVEYAGAGLPRAWPFLLAGEILQVGAGTNHGGGRYVILPPE